MEEGFPLVLVTSVERFGTTDFFCPVLMFVFVIFVDKSCYGCGETGHISRNCPKKKGKLLHHHFNEVKSAHMSRVSFYKKGNVEN